MVSGNSLSNKKLYLLYDSNFEHYNVITNLKAVWQRRMYVMRVTLYMTKHTSVTACSLCAATPPCMKYQSIVVNATGGFLVRNVFRII